MRVKNQKEIVCQQVPSKADKKEEEEIREIVEKEKLDEFDHIRLKEKEEEEAEEEEILLGEPTEEVVMTTHVAK